MRSLKSLLKAQPENVQHGFQPVYYFTRCIGLWPFTNTYNSNGSIKGTRVRLFDWLWFLISICLYLTALFCSYKNVTNASTPRDYFLAYWMYNVAQISSFLFGAVSIILDMFNRNKLVNILRMFTVFDKEVRPFLKNLSTVQIVCESRVQMSFHQLEKVFAWN